MNTWFLVLFQNRGQVFGAKWMVPINVIPSQVLNIGCQIDYLHPKRLGFVIYLVLHMHQFQKHHLLINYFYLEYKRRTYFPRDVAGYQACHATNQPKDLPHAFEAGQPTHRDRKAGKFRENLKLLIGHVTRYPAPTLVGL